MNSKKAFTLVELSITMAISVIIGLMVFTVSFLVSNYLNTSHQMTEINDELNEFTNCINEINESYQTSDYEIIISLSNKELNFHSEIGDITVSFTNGNLYKNEEIIQTCNYITSVDFEKQGTLTKCLVTYKDNFTYVVLINKRV